MDTLCKHNSKLSDPPSKSCYAKEMTTDNFINGVLGRYLILFL